MTFSLKNAGATYQRVMTYIFYDYMNEIRGVYIDDLLAKLKIHEQYFQVLEKVFDRLLEHNVRLNPKIFILGITLGKLLGFIIFKMGIKVCPNKVKYITNMHPPSILKEL